jgi:PAS domain S-box-containing protein
MAQPLPEDAQKIPYETEAYYRRYLIKVIMLLALPLIVGFGIGDILDKRYLVALILFLMFSLILLLYYFVQKSSRRSKEDTVYRYFFSIFFILFGFYLAYSIGYEGKLSRIPWAYLLPVVVFFALGELKAVIWISILYSAILFSSMYFTTNEPIAIDELKLRFYLSFSFVIVFSYLFERLKRKYQRDLIDNQKILKESENRFREAYENLKYEMKERKRIEAAMRQSEERFREMAENIHEVFWLFDNAEQKVLYCSPAYEEIWGRSIEDLYNRYEEWGESIHPDDLKYAQESFAKIIETGGGEPREYRIVRPDGSIRWLSDRGFAIKDKEGNVIRITGIAEDFTKRKLAEEALRESEEKYKNLFNNAQVGIFRSSIKDGRLLETNLRNAEIGGWDNVNEFLDEWVGSERYVDSGSRERLLNELYEKGKVNNFETRFLRKDNSIFWARMSARINREQGHIEGVIQDVTGEKQALETLRQSEMRYRAVVEDTPAMICRFLPDGTLTFGNDAYCEYFAIKKDSLVGQNFFQFIPEEDREKVRNTFLSLNNNKSMITYEHHALGPDGKIVWQEWTDRALFDEQGNITEYQSIGQDITERKLAERELIRSEARLKEAQKIAHVGDWNLNVETGRASWSEELRRIMGIGPEVVAGPKKLLSLIHPADRNLVEQGMQDALEKDKPYEVKYRLIRPDGDERIIHSRARVVRSDDGRPLRMVGVAQDMTDQKRIQADLKEAYDIINKSPAVAFLWKNQEGWPVELVTDNVQELFGYTAEDLISGVIPYSETVHPDDLDRVAGEVSGYSAEPGRERFTHIPYRIVCKNGEVKWVDDRTYIRRDEDGNITHYQGIVLDVSSSKEAEQALKESEEKFRNLAEKSPNMIFINKKGRVVYANQRCEDVMRYKREQLYAPDFDFLSLIAPECTEIIKTSMAKHMAGNEVEPYEYAIINKDGTRIEVINTTKLIDYEGEQSILGIVTDITERKQMEREREALIAELEAKNAELERFTYSVSHDLKSPLITIKGFLGLLEKDVARGDTNKMKTDITRIANATDQMKSLLDELLELSRIGRLVNLPEEISSENLVHATVETLSGTIAESKVKIEILFN